MTAGPSTRPAGDATTGDDGPLALAADFPAVNRDDWRRLAAAVLQRSGAPADVDPEFALGRDTYDGLRLRPLYTADDVADLPPTGMAGAAPFVRGAGLPQGTGGWDVRQRHADPDPERTAAAIAADLAGGVTSLWLVIGATGVAIGDSKQAVAQVDLAAVPLALDAGADVRAAAGPLLAAGWERGSLGADPIGVRAGTGAAADVDLLAGLADDVGDRPELRIATVDATRYHDAGADDATEVGVATAIGVAYLRALVEHGRSVAEALRAIEFRFAVTDDQFAGITKLRAARRLWARVAELSGAPGHGAQHQHAVTSAAMSTQRDPWVNMLRATVATFAAAVGGAEAITVLPYDHALGRPDGFARRIARNTQAILHDESSLGRVVDPAGGSWYVEYRTAGLAEKAWAVFTGIEAAGGALAALDAGRFDALVQAPRERRAEDIAHRRAPLTGVSEFALVTEPAVVREPLPPPPGGGRAGLQPHRYAEAFEAWRDRADAAAERPRVFLAVLGRPAEHSAPAGFAANLFQSGGFEVVRGPVDEFAASGTALACLCGSDDGYTNGGADSVAALRSAGAKQVWLAGRAPDGVPVDRTIRAGDDALAALQAAFELVEMPA